MVNYMVSLDNSESAAVAFYTALNLVKPGDQLYLLTVCDDLKPYAIHSYWGLDIPTDIYSEAQEKAKKEARDLLRSYGHLCLQRNIDCHLLLGVSDHVGEMITQAVDKKKIDVLILGRRGMSKIKRIFMGSNSKYCVEHANCNVLVVKHDPALLPSNSNFAGKAEELRLEEEKMEETRKKKLDELHHKMETMNINYEESAVKKEA